MERFNLKKLNNVEINEQYQVKISSRLEALENMDDNLKINGTRESVTKYITTSAMESYCELKQHKIWSDKKCLKLLDQRMLAKLQ
jgi:hypothetical protein